MHDQPTTDNLISAYAPKGAIKKPVLKMPNAKGKLKVTDLKPNNQNDGDDIERKSFSILNSNEQHTFSKYRTITPQSTTDDSANVGKSQEDAFSSQPPALKKLKNTPQPHIPSEAKPSTTIPMAKGPN